MEGEPWMVGFASTLLEPRFICWFLAEILVVLVVYGVIRSLNYLFGAAAPDTATIAPETLLPPQQKTTKEKLQSQQRTDEELQLLHTTEEQFQPRTKEQLQSLQGTEEEHQSQHTTEGEDQSTSRYLSSQQTTEDEAQLQQIMESKLHSTIEAELRPQQTIKEALQAQQAAEEELQHQQTHGVGLQPRQRIDEEFQLKHRRAKEEELLPQQSPAEDGLRTAIKQMLYLLTNLWNGKSLRKGKRTMKACFKKINLPTKFLTSHSPNASNRSMRDYDETSNLPHSFKSLFSLHHEVDRFIDYNSLSKLDGMIIKFPISGAGYREILYKIIQDNSDLLERFFCNYFKSAGLSIDIWMHTSQFTCQSAKKCVRRLKIATALLCFMGNELAKADCISFDSDLRNHYFSVCAGRYIENLIKAADSISNLEWSAHHIYQMLVLYEANADVLRAFGHPDRSDRIFQQMRANFKRVFDEIKCLICDKLNSSQYAITCIRHPVTNFLLESMKLFENHSSIIQDILVGDHSSSLSCLLYEVISCWVEELEKHLVTEELKKHSVPETHGSNYVFLLNNLTHFMVEVKSILKVLIPNEYAEILQALQLRINEYTSKYLEKCWGPVRELVKLDSGRKPCLSSVVTFISRFSDICKCQKTWVLQTQLKEKLRNEIRGYVIRPYEEFSEELQKKTKPHDAVLKELQKTFLLFYQGSKYKTALELGKTVEGLFETEYKDRIL